MSFGRQRAEGNAGGVEAFENSLQRLDVLQRQRPLGHLQLEQIAQHGHRALVDQRRVLLEQPVVAALHRLLQRADHVRVVGMVFAAIDELEQATRLDRLAVVPGLGGQRLLLGFEIDETRTLDAAGDATEAELHHLIGKPHRFEQLCTAIGGDRGDAHLRDDLQQALGDALAVVLEHFVEIAEHFAGTDQVAQHLVGEEGIDRRRAEADQHREMVRITRGGGLHQNVAIAAQAGLDQPMMHRTHRQRGMHRQLARCDVAVAQHQQYLAAAHGFLGLIGDIVHRGFEPE